MLSSRQFLGAAESSPKILDGDVLEYGVSQADLEVFHCAVGTSCSGMGEAMEYGVSQADLDIFQCAVGTSCSGIGEERPVLGVAEAGDMRLLEGLPG